MTVKPDKKVLQKRSPSYSVKEIADLFYVSNQTIYEWIKKETFPPADSQLANGKFNAKKMMWNKETVQRELTRRAAEVK